MKQHVKATLVGIAAGAIAAAIGGSVVVNMAVRDVNDSWSATATADAAIGLTEQARWEEDSTATVAVWTQWAVDDQATQEAYATEQQNEEWDAEAQSHHDALNLTATEAAIETNEANIEATDVAMSATDNQGALLTRTPVLAMTLTADYFFNATQYAGFEEEQAHELATLEAKKAEDSDA